MPLVLALEPDENQAAILSGLILNQLRAELQLVDAKASAIAAIRRHIPDLVLLSSDVSRNDERDITAFLRTLEGADHVKTLTIPKMHIGGEAGPSGGFLRSFKGRPAISKPQGCEPRVFAKQVKRWLHRAEELKAERHAWPPLSDTPVKMPVIMDARSLRDLAEPSRPRDRWFERQPVRRPHPPHEQPEAAGSGRRIRVPSGMPHQAGPPRAAQRLTSVTSRQSLLLLTLASALRRLDAVSVLAA